MIEACCPLSDTDLTCLVKPRTGVRTLCYQAGSEVCTSNQDPDHVPRTCCSGARFSVLLNRWYAAMIIRCVEGVHDSR